MAGKMSILTNGILKENPTLRLVLGTCPTLAISTVAFNGLGMGVAATFVLVCSNMAIAALRKVIPDKVRIPAYVVVIAGFVTLVMMAVKAYAPDLDKALGVYLPLIVVNCIILGRAEMFANKNTIFDSALDGVGMGIGFTLNLVLMGSIREIFGAGTVFGMQILPKAIDPIAVLVSPPGGFFIFGCMIALAIKLEALTLPKAPVSGAACEAGCPGCALATGSDVDGAAACPSAVKEGEK